MTLYAWCQIIFVLSCGKLLSMATWRKLGELQPASPSAPPAAPANRGGRLEGRAGGEARYALPMTRWGRCHTPLMPEPMATLSKSLNQHIRLQSLDSVATDVYWKASSRFSGVSLSRTGPILPLYESTQSGQHEHPKMSYLLYNRNLFR
jgi:hypothetical protein